MSGASIDMLTHGEIIKHYARIIHKVGK